MALDYLHVNDLATATLDDTDQIIVGESNAFKKASVASLKGSIIGSEAEYTEDTVPYLSARQTKNAGIVGKVAMEQLVGGSIGWNQLIGTLNSYGALNNCTKSYDSSTQTATLTPSNYTNNACGIYFAQTLIVGHKYCLCVTVNPESSVDFRIDDSNSSTGRLFQAAANVENNFANIINAATAVAIIYARISDASWNSQKYKLKNIQLLDITQMFGATIADYIYQLETATAGAGIAKLKSWGINLDTYHAYDTGSIQSVEATAHVTTGFNQWDGVYEAGTYNQTTGEKSSSQASLTNRSANKVRILPNTTYYHVGGGMRVFFYDGNEGYISNMALSSPQGIFTPPANARYLTFQTSNTLDMEAICINISKTTGSPKNGDYVPYSGRTYSLGSDTLRGIPKLVNGELDYDGDIKLPDGTIKRKYGERAYQSGDTSDGTTMITDGTTTVYRLTTPTTESSTPFQRIQTVDADGTESFTANSVVPVGHKTLIPENVLGALQTLVG